MNIYSYLYTKYFHSYSQLLHSISRYAFPHRLPPWYFSWLHLLSWNATSTSRSSSCICNDHQERIMASPKITQKRWIFQRLADWKRVQCRELRVRLSYPLYNRHIREHTEIGRSSAQAWCWSQPLLCASCWRRESEDQVLHIVHTYLRGAEIHCWCDERGIWYNPEA